MLVLVDSANTAVINYGVFNALIDWLIDNSLWFVVFIAWHGITAWHGIVFLSIKSHSIQKPCMGLHNIAPVVVVVCRLKPCSSSNALLEKPFSCLVWQNKTFGTVIILYTVSELYTVYSKVYNPFFLPMHSTKIGWLAQLVERATVNRKATSSTLVSSV